MCVSCLRWPGAHTLHTHLTSWMLSSAFPLPNAYNMCVSAIYGYHIRAAHNSHSKSSETPSSSSLPRDLSFISLFLRVSS